MCRDKWGDKLEVNHKHTLDIGPALLEATKRMQSLGTGDRLVTCNSELVEADSDTTM